MNGEFDSTTKAARRTLLDVLGLLGKHRKAAILVGAQAIYLWQSGTTGSRVDFLVPKSLSGRGKRSAKLAAQGDRLALRAGGLEGALVDSAAMDITALETDDARSFRIAVAGPAALLVAKLWKLGERYSDRPSRLHNKDALDVYRLLRTVPRARLVDGFARLRANEFLAASATQGLTYLDILFGDPASRGAEMAAEALEPLEDAATTRLASSTLARELVDALTST